MGGGGSFGMADVCAFVCGTGIEVYNVANGRFTNCNGRNLCGNLLFLEFAEVHLLL